MFHLHHADRFEPLLDALAAVLAPPLADPFTADVVAVPTIGLRDAAMAGLGHRLGSTGRADGVVANVEFVFPGRLVARALDLPEDDPWQLERLTWVVLDVLERGTVEVPVAREDRWATARRLADLFDRYATQRPTMIARWAAGSDGDGTAGEDGTEGLVDPAQRWQPALWREVRARIGTPSPPERLPGLLAALRSGSLQPNLPERVSVFGLAALAPTVLRVLEALGEARDVHVFVRHPSHVLWASEPHALSALTPRMQLDLTPSVSHPLLASWGRPALETRALVAGSASAVLHAEGAGTNEASGLLGAVQAAIRNDTAPARVPGLDPADGTVQVHACHGVVRQLEVLRDALGHAFTADATLRPHDVVVLCPDLERFASLVEPVFARGNLPVPVRVGDRSLATEEPVAAALSALLGLVQGRVALSEVLTFLQREAVRLRFGFSQDDLERLTAWCVDLGTRWGLEPRHREQWGIPGELTSGTWRAAVDQLLAGAAMAAPTPREVVGGVAPYDHMDSDGFARAGRLADFIARLVRLHDEVRVSATPAVWIERLHRIVDEFLCTIPDDQWRLQQLHRTLDEIATSAGGTSIELDLTDVQALLASQLDDTPGRLALRTGSVTVSSLVPQRGVPARVVCLLGLDDDVLRPGTFDGDDILGARPCIGEHHPRFEQRHLLLDAVLAAQDRLIVVCDGADITTNRPVPFATPLAELLDVIRDAVELDDKLRPVVSHHPRHGFAEPALPFTFDPVMRQAALARREMVQAGAGHEEGRWSLPAVELTEVTLAELQLAMTRPSRVLLDKRLQVRLPREVDAPDDNLAVEVDSLRLSGLGRDLLAARTAGRSADEWAAAARHDGALPPGALADAVLGDVTDEITEMIANADEFGVPLVGRDAVEVDVLVDGVRVRGTIGGIDAHCLVRVDYLRPWPARMLGLGLELALAQLHEPAAEWSAVFVSRKESGKGSSALRLQLRGDDEERVEHARALLGVAIELAEWATRDAVPLFDRISFRLAQDDFAGVDYMLGDRLFDEHAELLWSGMSVETLRDDPIEPSDPEPVRALAPASRAVAVAKWVWGTFGNAIERVEEDRE